MTQEYNRITKLNQTDALIKKMKFESRDTEVMYQLAVTV